MENNRQLPNETQKTVGSDNGLNEIRTQLDNILQSKYVFKAREPFCKDYETLLNCEGQCAETERYLISGIRYGSMGVFINYSGKKQKDPVDALNEVIDGKIIQEFQWMKKLRFYAEILCLVLTEPHYKNMFPRCAEKIAIISRGENGHLIKSSVGIVKNPIQYTLNHKPVSYPDLETIKIRKYADDFREMICAVIDELVSDGKTDAKMLLSLAQWVGYQRNLAATEVMPEKKDPLVMKRNQEKLALLQDKQPLADTLKAGKVSNHSAVTDSTDRKVTASTNKDAALKKEYTPTGPKKNEAVKAVEDHDIDKIQNFDEFRHALAMLEVYGAELSSSVLRLRKENDEKTGKLIGAQKRTAELEEENRKAALSLKQQMEETATLSGRIREYEEQVADLRNHIAALEKENADQKQYIDHQKQTMSIYQVDTKNNSAEEKKALAAKLKPQYRDYKEIAPDKEQLSDEEAILVEIIEDIFGILNKNGIDVTN